MGLLNLFKIFEMIRHFKKMILPNQGRRETNSNSFMALCNFAVETALPYWSYALQDKLWFSAKTASGTLDKENL